MAGRAAGIPDRASAIPTATSSRASGPPTCTSSARTSPASTRSSGRRSSWPPACRCRGTVHAHGFITLGGREDEQEPGHLRGADAARRAVRQRRGALGAAQRGALRPRRRLLDGQVRRPLQRRPRQRLRQPGVAHHQDGAALLRGSRSRAGQRAPPIDDELRSTAARVVPVYDAAMDGCEFSEAMAAARQLVGRANKYIEETAPWTLHREADDARWARCAPSCSRPCGSRRCCSIP